MKKAFGMITLAVAVILGILCWMKLPDTVICQIGFNGKASNSMPKIFAVVVPSIVSLLGSGLIIIGDEDSRSKGMAIALIGIGIMIVTLFVNR